MKKTLIFVSIAAIIIIAVALYFTLEEDSASAVTVNPVRGEFIVSVTTTGELQAENSIEIMAPVNARQAGIYNMKISKLIPEGTNVKKGEFVAELDKSEISQKIKELELSVQQLETQLLQKKLDSTLTLSAARDELENLKFSLEEKKLIMEQSKYEPPATIRQAEIDYERAQRNLKQAKKNYDTKVKQAIASISVVEADLKKEQQRLAIMTDIFNEFTITAPADGMVVYEKEWSGRKRVVGSTVSPWDPTVARLPDLSTMQSKTYINEVDIQKIKKGQKVVIGLDAMPDKELHGEIIQVASIGEQIRNYDSKVFEVIIEVQEEDTTLRPAMTTMNEIIVQTVDSALHIPLESIQTNGDTTFVYKENGGGLVRQQVELGLQNENEVIIKKGLNAEDEVYLNVPENADELKLVKLKENITEK